MTADVRQSALLDEVTAAREDLERAEAALEAYDAAEAERRLATKKLHALFVKDWAPTVSANTLRDLEKPLGEPER